MSRRIDLAELGRKRSYAAAVSGSPFGRNALGRSDSVDYFFKTGVCVVINSGEIKRGKYSVTEDGWYATVLGYGQMIFDA
jgi:hypothetical protein